MTGNPYHVRSISFPSRSHPDSLRVEEELNNLKAWEISAASTTSPSKLNKIQIGLTGFSELFNCVESLLNLSLTKQELIHHQNRELVDLVLDGSVRLLDICGTVRDIFFLMKEHAQNLQSALRRRGLDKSNIETKISAYVSFRKKVKKDINASLVALKKMGSQWASSSCLDQQQQSKLARMLREVIIMTISIFQYLLWSISATRTEQKIGGWSLVSKLMRKGQVMCEMENEGMGEMKFVDVALQSLARCASSEEAKVEKAQKGLEAMESSIKNLEAGLECTFRHLIKTRVALLNILTH